MKLSIDHLTKQYYVERDGRQNLALSDVSLSVADGEFMAIVGPSGCGKTTLLNIVAGLLPYDRGSVSIDGTRDHGTPAWTAPWCFSRRACCPGAPSAGNVRYGMELHKRFDQRHDARADGVFHPAGRARRLRAPLPVGAVRRHAAARQPRARARDRSAGAADGRAVCRPRRPDARAHAGRTAEDLGRGAQDRVVHHPSDQRGGVSGRPGGRAERPAGPRQRRLHDSVRTAATAQREAGPPVSRDRRTPSGGWWKRHRSASAWPRRTAREHARTRAAGAAAADLLSPPRRTDSRRDGRR